VFAHYVNSGGNTSEYRLLDNVLDSVCKRSDPRGEESFKGSAPWELVRMPGCLCIKQAVFNAGHGLSCNNCTVVHVHRVSVAYAVDTNGL
jgi:hypothetical protein